ncbi:hypothetical protein FRB94_011868 [Tulasnella sp. JGI-2019a]|nr:hypothetical protein FRB94_011868 [Tulasnella sp. JGI-2019a]KAG9014446.1 hypothetical protein FRB93_013571 [Tulasnella sp. JGI-2019a]
MNYSTLLCAALLAVSVRGQDVTKLYGQCAGDGLTWPPCITGTTCIYFNDWFSQCLPPPKTTSSSADPESTTTT